MRIDHILDRVGNNIARRQRIKHAIVAHSNAIVNGDGVEFGSIATHAFYLFLNNLSDFVQVCMSWYKLCERIDDGNNGFTKLFAFHTRGYP